MRCRLQLKNDIDQLFLNSWQEFQRVVYYFAIAFQKIWSIARLKDLVVLLQSNSQRQVEIH